MPKEKQIDASHDKLETVHALVCELICTHTTLFLLEQIIFKQILRVNEVN